MKSRSSCCLGGVLALLDPKLVTPWLRTLPENDLVSSLLFLVVSVSSPRLLVLLLLTPILVLLLPLLLLCFS